MISSLSDVTIILYYKSDSMASYEMASTALLLTLYCHLTVLMADLPGEPTIDTI